MKHVVIVSKDATRKDYFPVYGNKYWKTPNIDELAAKGTVFRRHYTVAPSTSMAFTSMFTGVYPYETGREKYTEIKDFDIKGGTTLFDEMEKKGYTCHLVWPSHYIIYAERFSRCYGKNTIHHDSLAFNQRVGPHADKASLAVDEALVEETYKKLLDEVNSIDTSVPVFLWVHMPHCFLGRIAYGSDIDIFDRFVGDIRAKFGDNIIVTADHGTCDGKNGKTAYGFDLFESAISIPLITPRLEGKEEITFPTTNADLMTFILDERVPHRDFVISDTAYFSQPHRKIALIKDNYKYVYDKNNKKESLFDVAYDPAENMDLCQDLMFDVDRHRWVNRYQVLFYPYNDEAKAHLEYLREQFNLIWKCGPFWKEKYNKLFNRAKNTLKNFREIRRQVKMSNRKLTNGNEE